MASLKSLRLGAHTPSASSSTSTQCRTGVVVPVCRCWMQPMLAETMVCGCSAARSRELAVAQLRRPARAAAPNRCRPSRSTGATLGARESTSKPSARSAASTPPRSCWPCCSVHGGWNARRCGLAVGGPSAARQLLQARLELRHQVGQQLAQVLRQRADAPRLRRTAGSCARQWPYSFTVTPQPDAFITIASTCRAGQPRPAATRRRCCGACRPGRRRGRSGAVRIAPQQPAPSATRVWMPAASSTRAVALLMLGIIAGCTQPISSSTLRACSRVGHGAPPRRPAAGTLFFSAAGSSGRIQLAELHRRREQRRGQAFLQRPARRPLGRRALDPLLDDAAADLDQVAVLHARGAGGLAVAAGQAAVEVQLRRARDGLRLRAPA